jgi:hypothetical protein
MNKLVKAFKELTKIGYFAQHNYWCCQSCAWSAMTDEQAKKAVFYHEQDSDDLEENNFCYLSWSGDGQEIVNILNNNGIEVEWSGSETDRIKISI